MHDIKKRYIINALVNIYVLGTKRPYTVYTHRMYWCHKKVNKIEGEDEKLKTIEKKVYQKTETHEKKKHTHFILHT